MKINLQLCAMLTLALLSLASLKVVAQTPEAIQAYEQAKAMAAKQIMPRSEIKILLKRAITLSPKYSDAYFLLGQVYSGGDWIDTAIIHFKTAIKLSPDNPVYYYHLGNEFAMIEQYDSALENYSEAIRLGLPYEYALNAYQKIYFDRAQIYIATGQIDNVIKDLNTIIEKEPTDASWYAIRALMYYKKKQYSLAMADCLKGIEYLPDASVSLRSKLYFVLSKIYLAQGKPDQAAKANADAVKSGDFETIKLRAYWSRWLQQPDWAIEDFSIAIDLAPNKTEFSRYRAQVYERIGKFALAYADYSRIMAIYPNDYIYISERGNVAKWMGNYQQAMTDFETVSHLDSNNVIDVDYLIMATAVRIGDFTKAKKYADIVLRSPLHPDRSLLYGSKGVFFKKYLEAVILYTQGRHEEVLSKLNSAITVYNSGVFKRFIGFHNLGPKAFYIDVLALKGNALEQLGRFSEASDTFDQALLINPAQPVVVDALKKLKQKQVVAKLKDKTLPVIELISPQLARGLKIVKVESRVEIVGKAKDESGIKSITINGIPVTKIEEDGVFITNVMLKAGQNKFTIIATDKNNNVATNTFDVKATVEARDAATVETQIVPVVTGKTPVFYAILIGENEYLDPAIDDLSNPVKDAGQLKYILQSKYTFDSKNIETLYNKSREEIIQAIVERSNTLTENDNLIIFYAGHGIAEKDKFGDVDGYWIPSSAKKGITSTYISSDDINKALKRSESKHILIIADACFSGAFTRSMSADAPKDIQTQYKYNSRKIMASGNMEPVPDNSKFIYYLNKNLQDNKLKYLTAKDLFNSFYKAVINNTDTLPQYAAIKNVGDEGGEFVFIKK